MMQKIALGKSRIAVSRIGLGTVKFGRNQGVQYPQEFQLPSDYEIQELLAYAQQLGVNLLDTAPAYGTSEERLGELIKGQRHDWVICTKVGEEFVNGESQHDFSPNAIRLSIERSLRRLNTDVLDIVLVHSNGDDEKIIEEDAVFETLNRLKQAGMIRAYGMSTKTIEGGLMTVDQSDVVMVTYNPIQTEERPVIVYAEEKNKGIFIKKPLASGHIHKISADDPVRAVMHFIFQESGISSIIVGTLNKQNLAYNVECAVEALEAQKVAR